MIAARNRHDRSQLTWEGRLHYHSHICPLCGHYWKCLDVHCAKPFRSFHPVKCHN
jgi:hypothetical protein